MRIAALAVLFLFTLGANAAPPLRIGLEGTYPPFSFLDDNGALTGFDVEIGKAIGEHLGRPVSYVQSRWDGMFAALDADRFDIVINSVTVTEERKKRFLFSEPYCFTGVQLVARAGSPIARAEDLNGKKVGVGLGTIHEKWLRDNHIPADIRTYEDDASRNQDLLVGRIDAVLNDRLAVAHMLKQYQGKLIAAGQPLDRQEKAVVIRMDHPELKAEIDKAVAAMRADGTLSKISEKWFGIDATR